MERLPQVVVTGMLTCGTETIRKGYTRFIFFYFLVIERPEFSHSNNF